jgi:predicted small lipoprotein YifL
MWGCGWSRGVARTRTVALLLALGAAHALSGCGSATPRRLPPARSVAAAPLTEARPPSGLQPTIEDRVAQYGPTARARMRPYFAAARVPYPPTRFLLLGLKRERELQLYAAGPAQDLTFIRSFAILGASGGLGPKLREGDHQVPEGIYSILYLNPNSVAHLSLALSYPNDFDRARADGDGRDAATLGGDIMIHGGTGSVGCLAIGDQASEDVFVLAADSNWQDAVVIISPVDFRQTGLPAGYRPTQPWVNALYNWLRATLANLPPAPPTASSVAAGTR